MYWPLRFGFGMGVVSIDAFEMCLESLPNFHGENPTTFCLILVVEIQQHFALDASQHIKRYSHQAFQVRIRQWGCPIFTAKNPKEFCVWCAMAHLQGSMPIYKVCIDMLVLRQAEALHNIKHVDMCRIRGETNFTQLTWIKTITP